MKHYNVTGMSCAACSARVEKAVSSLPDVTACAVNLLTHSMSVEGSASAAEVIGAVEKAGYGASEVGGGKQKRRGFPENSSDGEDAARHDTVNASGKYDRADHAPLARAESESALSVALRHGLQTLLGRAHHGGKIHYDKRERARHERCFHAEELTEEQHSDKSVNYRRYAGQRFRRVFDGGDDPFAFRVFGEVYRRTHSERYHDGKRRRDDIQRIEYSLFL